MMYRIGVLLYVILQFLAFLFVLVGTPIDMLRPLGLSRLSNTQCLTLWGVKDECYSTKYDRRSEELWAKCPHRRLQFGSAAGFAVISVMVYGAAFILGFIMLFRGFFFCWVCLTLSIAGIITLGIVWVLVVVAYYTDDGRRCPREILYSNLGAGFILFVVAWCLNIIGTVFLLLESQNADAGEVETPPQDSKEQ